MSRLPARVRAQVAAEQEARTAVLFRAPEARLEEAQLRGALYGVLLAICDNPDHSHGNRNVRILERHFLHDTPVAELAQQFGLARHEVQSVIDWVKDEAAQHRALLRDVCDPLPGAKPAAAPVPPLHPHVRFGTPKVTR